MLFSVAEYYLFLSWIFIVRALDARSGFGRFSSQGARISFKEQPPGVCLGSPGARVYVGLYFFLPHLNSAPDIAQTVSARIFHRLLWSRRLCR